MEAGSRIADRFEVEAQVGAGGMGIVYRAHDLVSGRKVALKVLGKTADPNAEARFSREAALLADLRHPGIVRYLAHGRTSPGDDGELFLAMQWLEGVDLAHRLANDGLRLQETLTLFRRVAEALAFAHGRGVVHRDLKPSNLFLIEGEVDRVRLLDFGLARRVVEPRGMTRTGSVFGTPGYMAPEQARGSRDIGPEADVWALGCIVFEALAGRPPFEADEPLAILGKVLTEDAPSLVTVRADLPPSLVSLVARMLSREPAHRPRDGAALLEALEGIGAVSDAPGPMRSAPPLSLTAGEQRIGTLVVIDDPRAEPALANLTAKLAPVVQAGERQVSFLFQSRGRATDRAADAARFALAARTALPHAHVAIATGRTPLSRAKTTAVHDALRATAERLLEGEPGIAIDALTAGLLATTGFEIAGEGGRRVLLSERAGAVRTLLGRASPFVGRDRELAMIDGAIADAAEDSASRVVVVLGAPGLGKTRLRDEALRRLDATWVVWSTRGDAAAVGAPFSAVGQALRDAAGVVDGDPIDVRRERLADHFAPTLGRDADRVLPFVGEIANAPFDDESRVQLRAARRDPQLLADQVRRAFEDVVVAQTRARPLLLVVDDVQVADAPSLSLLDAALRRAADAPFVLLVLGRREVADAAAQLGPGRPRLTVELGELRPRACEALVRAVLGDVDAATMRSIVDRAAGNALFLEELIRAAAAGQEAGSAETVIAMVQSRLEALDGDARRMLRAASVFGGVFWRGAVEALLGFGRELDVGATLDRLVEAELVTVRGEGRFAGEIEYAFRHALVRDAAYAMLTDQDRALGHALAAAWLERAGESNAAIVAEHHELGGESARAAGFWLRAAEQAVEANDLSGALARVERGIACGAEGVLLGALEHVRAQALRWRSENAATLAAAERALGLLPAGTMRWFDAAGDAAVSSSRLGRIEMLEAHAELLRDTVVESGEPEAALRARLVALCRVAVELQHAGKTALVAELVDRIELEGRELLPREPGIAGTFAHVRATRALTAGDPAQTLRLLEEGATFFEQAGDLRHECLELGNLGYVRIELGLVEEGERALRDALVGAQRMELALVECGIRANLALALLRLSRLDEARDQAERSFALSTARGNVRLAGAARLYLAMILAAMGDRAAAHGVLDEAMEMLASVPSYRAYGFALRARLALDERDLERASAASEEASRILEAQGGIEAGEAFVRLVRVEALAALDREQEARDALATAVERLQARAAKITDGALRASFLERVPENAATMARVSA